MAYTVSDTAGNPASVSRIVTVNAATSTNNNCTISSSITSAQGSDNQLVVQGNQLQTITYSISSDCDQLNDTNIFGQQLVSGLPTGITVSLSGNTVTISGTPTSQASGTYNYSIIINNSKPGTEIDPYILATTSTTITGVINVDVPVDELVLSSSQNTLNQTVCVESPIEPIIFQLGGDATNASVAGLPYGIQAILDDNQNTITISGSASVSNTLTNFYFSVTSVGSQSKTISGEIEVRPLSYLTITSAPPTYDQTICDDYSGRGESIVPITFTFGGGATSFNVTGLPNGLSAVQVGSNEIRITGKADIGVTQPTVYNYTITTTGNECENQGVSGSASAPSFVGRIVVNPVEQIARTSGDVNVVVNSIANGSEAQLTNKSFNLSFQLTNAPVYILTWDDSSINYSGIVETFDPNTGVLTISGNPGATETSTHPVFKTYNYTITTGSTTGTCSAASISGSIELVDGTVQPDTYTINVTAANSGDYTLSGSDRNGAVSGNDPSVTINVGDTIDFAVDASGHPFYLKTVQGTGTGNLIGGVTNNGATNGTVSWTPTAAGTYYYQCSLHNGMYGTITVN